MILEVTGRPLKKREHSPANFSNLSYRLISDTLQCGQEQMTTVLLGTYQNQKLRHLSGSSERSIAHTESFRSQEL